MVRGAYLSPIAILAVITILIGLADEEAATAAKRLIIAFLKAGVYEAIAAERLDAAPVETDAGIFIIDART